MDINIDTLSFIYKIATIMKIQLLNDLHIEFSGFDIPATDVDVIVLAGDIGVGFNGLEWIEQQCVEKPVIYVPGNHEFYRHDFFKDPYPKLPLNCVPKCHF